MQTSLGSLILFISSCAASENTKLSIFVSTISFPRKFHFLLIFAPYYNMKYGVKNLAELSMYNATFISLSYFLDHASWTRVSLAAVNVFIYCSHFIASHNDNSP